MYFLPVYFQNNIQTICLSSLKIHKIIISLFSIYFDKIFFELIVSALHTKNNCVHTLKLLCSNKIKIKNSLLTFRTYLSCTF